MDRMTNTITGDAFSADRPMQDDYDWRWENLEALIASRRPKTLAEILPDGLDSEIEVIPEGAPLPVEIIRVVASGNYYFDGSFDAWVLREDGTIEVATLVPGSMTGYSRLDPPEWNPPVVAYQT